MEYHEAQRNLVQKIRNIPLERWSFEDANENRSSPQVNFRSSAAGSSIVSEYPMMWYKCNSNLVDYQAEVAPNKYWRMTDNHTSVFCLRTKNGFGIAFLKSAEIDDFYHSLLSKYFRREGKEEALGQLKRYLTYFQRTRSKELEHLTKALEQVDFLTQLPYR